MNTNNGIDIVGFTNSTDDNSKDDDVLVDQHDDGNDTLYWNVEIHDDNVELALQI